jgi:hypothetical protein
MGWKLEFITETDFTNHVAATITQYDKKLLPIDIEKFNSNIVDPVKMIFDKNVYQYSWGELIGNEIFRQRDKSANNDIGYFHQRIFQYIAKCRVPDNGKEGGWDVIVHDENGIDLPEGERVRTIYVEMKNKHNTMNSSSAGKTYIKMQNQLLQDDDCACFLVEAIAKKSQNVKWTTTVNGTNVSHKRIRRVSMDQFYALVTGCDTAFYDMCMELPNTISKVVSSDKNITIPSDTVLEELRNIASLMNFKEEELAMSMAVYMLGFSTYQGFEQCISGNDFLENQNVLKRLYAYAKKEKQ